MPLLWWQHRKSLRRDDENSASVSWGGALALASLLTVMMAPAAVADADETEQVAAEVAAASDGDMVVAPMMDGSLTVDAVSVSVPSDPAGSVKLTGQGHGQWSSAVSVTLPLEIQAAKAKVTKDGTVVYKATRGKHVDLAVQVLADGSVRMLTILQNANALMRFTYSIGDATPQIQADGSVNLVQRSPGDGVVVEGIVATIAAPWATDAKGHPVATHYEVSGDGNLVQVIQADKQTAYPVVSDPTIGVTWQGFNVWFNRAETYRIGNVNAAGFLMFGTIVTANFVAIAIGWTVGAVMGYASSTYNAGKCLKYTWPLALSSFGSYTGGNCY